MAPPELLLVSGSIRRGSTNTAVVRTAAIGAAGAYRASVFDRLRDLPHFDPDDDASGAPPHPAVAALRAAIAEAAGVLFCTPEYAGGLPGSFKNLLDWSVGGGEIYGKPVAWINASSSPTGAADAHVSLRLVLGYVGARIVEEACIAMPVRRDAITDDGLIDDPDLRARIDRALRALAAA